MNFIVKTFKSLLIALTAIILGLSPALTNAALCLL